MPLPDFIAKLYVKRFGKPAPDPVRTIEQMAEARAARKEAKKLRKARASADSSNHGSITSSGDHPDELIE